RSTRLVTLFPYTTLFRSRDRPRVEPRERRRADEPDRPVAGAKREARVERHEELGAEVRIIEGVRDARRRAAEIEPPEDFARRRSVGPDGERDEESLARRLFERDVQENEPRAGRSRSEDGRVE